MLPMFLPAQERFLNIEKAIPLLFELIRTRPELPSLCSCAVEQLVNAAVKHSKLFDNCGEAVVAAILDGCAELAFILRSNASLYDRYSSLFRRELEALMNAVGVPVMSTVLLAIAKSDVQAVLPFAGRLCGSLQQATGIDKDQLLEALTLIAAADPRPFTPAQIQRCFFGCGAGKDVSVSLLLLLGLAGQGADSEVSSRAAMSMSVLLAILLSHQIKKSVLSQPQRIAVLQALDVVKDYQPVGSRGFDKETMQAIVALRRDHGRLCVNLLRWGAGYQAAKGCVADFRAKPGSPHAAGGAGTLSRWGYIISITLRGGQKREGGTARPLDPSANIGHEAAADLRERSKRRDTKGGGAEGDGSAGLIVPASLTWSASSATVLPFPFSPAPQTIAPPTNNLLAALNESTNPFAASRDTTNRQAIEALGFSLPNGVGAVDHKDVVFSDVHSPAPLPGLVATPRGPTGAANDGTDDIRQEIRELKRRVEALELRLNQRGGATTLTWG